MAPREITLFSDAVDASTESRAFPLVNVEAGVVWCLASCVLLVLLTPLSSYVCMAVVGVLSGSRAWVWQVGGPVGLALPTILFACLAWPRRHLVGLGVGLAAAAIGILTLYRLHPERVPAWDPYGIWTWHALYLVGAVTTLAAAAILERSRSSRR